MVSDSTVINFTAPSLSALLGIKPPSGSVGSLLTEVLER